MQENIIQTDEAINIHEKILYIRYFLLIISIDRKDELALFNAWLTFGGGYEFHDQFLLLDTKFKKYFTNNNIYQDYLFALSNNNRKNTFTSSYNQAALDEDGDDETEIEEENFQSRTIKNCTELFNQHPKLEKFFASNFVFLNKLGIAWQSNYQDILSNDIENPAKNIICGKRKR